MLIQVHESLFPKNHYQYTNMGWNLHGSKWSETSKVRNFHGPKALVTATVCILSFDRLRTHYICTFDVIWCINWLAFIFQKSENRTKIWIQKLLFRNDLWEYWNGFMYNRFWRIALNWPNWHNRYMYHRGSKWRLSLRAMETLSRFSAF